MCGLVGIVSGQCGPPIPDDRVVQRLRDALAQRGPDAAGLWRRGHVALAHRRLAVIDPAAAANQPMASADGLCAIVYNGEVYNDADLRERFCAPARFRTRSDTETVLALLAERGPGALDLVRGMYALAFYDARRETLLLARDPLGIKPLYYARIGRQIAFASEPRALLAHPDLAPRPDLVTVSAYLSTIRTTLGDRTLFRGIRAVRPGERLAFDLAGDEPVLASRTHAAPRLAPEAAGGSPTGVRDLVADSVLAHLRSDVPVACMLSGGLDSSIVAALARPGQHLRTYCSGAPRGGDASDDFAHARAAAAALGTLHAEVPITRESFAARWPEMIRASGIPLSTPNEVAINAVAARARADGGVVLLSGEGADELFAGYELPLRQAAEFVARGDRSAAAAARFHAESAAWVPLAAKHAVLRPEIARAVEGDAALLGTYEDEFARVAAERDDVHEPLQAHLRFQRRINLAGLLLRLDSATMLEGIEGRTPFADVVVADLAEGLPIAEKCRLGGPLVETKIALRGAFASDLPEPIVRREKASFPLPFQEWMADRAGELRSSRFARAVFRDEAIDAVAARPAELWHLAWPMLNIAMWGERWWG